MRAPTFAYLLLISLGLACNPAEATPAAHEPAIRQNPVPDPKASAWQIGFDSLDKASFRDPSGRSQTEVRCLVAIGFDVCAWLWQAMSDDPARVVQELIARPPSTTTSLFTVALERSGSDAVASRLPEVYVALADEPERFLHATRALADDGSCTFRRRTVRRSSTTLWSAKPERRDPLLYLMASTLLLCREEVGEAADKNLANVMTRLGAPFSLAVFSRILDQSPRSYNVARDLFPFVKDEGKETRIDIAMNHLAGYIDQARGPHIVAAGFPSGRRRDDLKERLTSMYLDLASKNETREIAKLHGALAPYRDDAEVDAAFGDLIDATALDAPPPPLRR